MNKKEIEQAFIGRWRIYGLDDNIEDNAKVKEYARKFFEAGILLGQGFTTGELINADDTPTGIEITIKHDPVLDTADYGFSEWWEMYGKKIDRGRCEKKWAKLSFAERQACIAATPAYVVSTPDLQFRRHPMTYLNNKSWENQIIPHNNGNKPTNDNLSKLADILIG